MPLADIPPDLQHAFVAVEDHRFFKHFGIDPDRARPRRVARRASARRRAGWQHADAAARAHAVSLESKTLRRERLRKPRLPLLIDSALTKQQILELYLNRIYLSGGVYGVETMSRHLFGSRPRR